MGFVVYNCCNRLCIQEEFMDKTMSNIPKGCKQTEVGVTLMDWEIKDGSRCMIKGAYAN